MIDPLPTATEAIAPAMLEKVRGWMLDQALPLWIAQGISADHGGPIETFSLGNTPAPRITEMRTRVTGRQLYVFSHAHLMGVPGSLAAADRMFEFLTTRVWLGPKAGWCKTLCSAGQPLDLSADLYDFSFCLFGLAWYYQASGNAAALDYARQTLDLIETRFRHPSGLGFHHVLPEALPRQQNAHAHLLEAVLKLNSAAPSAALSALSGDLVTLFTDKFYNARHACLPEFFTPDLLPIREASGDYRFEPGHHFEWAWILAQHQKQSRTDHSGLIASLVASAERLGVCRHSGRTVNAVTTGGALMDPGSRTWPNTERIKGWLGLYEVTGTDPWRKVAATCDTLFKFHLGPQAPEGMWIDAFSEHGSVTTDAIPASTLYHIVLAFSEILRLSEAQENSTRSCEK